MICQKTTNVFLKKFPQYGQQRYQEIVLRVALVRLRFGDRYNYMRSVSSFIPVEIARYCKELGNWGSNTWCCCFQPLARDPGNLLKARKAKLHLRMHLITFSFSQGRLCRCGNNRWGIHSDIISRKRLCQLRVEILTSSTNNMLFQSVLSMRLQAWAEFVVPN